MSRGTDKLQELKHDIAELSDGYPAATNVLCYVTIEDPDRASEMITAMREMNLRGGQVWCAFKDHCRCDRRRFVDRVLGRDAQLLERPDLK